MVKYRILVGDVPGEWMNHPDGVGQLKALAPSLSSMAGSGVTITVEIQAELDSHKLFNLLAFISKSWHHLAFLAGRQVTSLGIFSNPWSASASASHPSEHILENLNPNVSVVSHGDTRTVGFKLLNGGSTNLVSVLPAMVIRLANVVAWSEKFGGECKLSTSKKVKWSTFNSVSMRCEQSPLIKVRPTEELEDAEVEGDESERE